MTSVDINFMGAFSFAVEHQNSTQSAKLKTLSSKMICGKIKITCSNIARKHTLIISKNKLSRLLTSGHLAVLQ